MEVTSARPRESAAVGSYATFYVGGLYLGIEVPRVQELLRYQEITPVPLASGVIEGLINLRGHIVTAVDMRRRLRLPPRPAEDTPMNIVLRARDVAVSLLVDEIGDVLTPPPESAAPPPATLRPELREIVARVFKLDEKLLLGLSAGLLLKSLCEASASLDGERC